MSVRDPADAGRRMSGGILDLIDQNFETEHAFFVRSIPLTFTIRIRRVWVPRNDCTEQRSYFDVHYPADLFEEGSLMVSAVTGVPHDRNHRRTPAKIPVERVVTVEFLSKPIAVYAIDLCADAQSSN